MGLLLIIMRNCGSDSAVGERLTFLGICWDKYHLKRRVRVLLSLALKRLAGIAASTIDVIGNKSCHGRISHLCS
jgi:hypothetical protein